MGTQRWIGRALLGGQEVRKGWWAGVGLGSPGSWGGVFLSESTGPGRGRGRRKRRAHPLAVPTSRGANTQKWGSRRGREARGLCSYPPAPKSGQHPPNSWWATAGLSWASGGAHRVRGGRNHGDPRPRGLCPCRVPAVFRPQWAAETPPRYPQLNHTGAGRWRMWVSKHRRCVQIKQSTAPAAGLCDGAGPTAAGPGGRPPLQWRGPGREGAFQPGPGPPPPGDEGTSSEFHICRLHTSHGGGECRGGSYLQTSLGEVEARGCPRRTWRGEGGGRPSESTRQR